MLVSREFRLSPEDVPEKDIWFAMGYRDAVPEERIRRIVLEYRDALVPQAVIKYMYQVVEAEKLSSTQVIMGGKLFSPRGIICSYLKGMTHAVIFVGTAGREFDAALRKLHAEGDILADYVADSIGSVLAESSVSQIEKDNKSWEGHISLSYSPGYCDWNIREQHLLFSLFPDEPCGIRLSDSSLMSPEKSVSGFFALGEELQRQPYHCEICKNTRCYKRKNAG